MGGGFLLLSAEHELPEDGGGGRTLRLNRCTNTHPQVCCRSQLSLQPNYPAPLSQYTKEGETTQIYILTSAGRFLPTSACANLT